MGTVLVKQMGRKATNPVDVLRQRTIRDSVTGCLCWTGKVDRDGYGRVSVKRRGWRAHRLAWVAVFGEIPVGRCVLHSCDNPPCCNVEHLFLGSQSDNHKDMIDKGRNAYGEAGGLSKMTKSVVEDARRRYASGERLADLAIEIGVNNSTLFEALRGWTWKSAGGPVQLSKRRNRKAE